MKVIIISDIKGNSKSIIPYSLNLAQYLKSTVDIIHVIDSRTLQGEQSPYSDSQSITPGNKLSHSEIKQREKNKAKLELDEILSKEASKLNYPLKINTIVEENTVKKSINNILDNNFDVLVLVNSQPDNYIFYSQKEIIETFKNSNSIFLAIPPGQHFKEVKKVLLATNFSDMIAINKGADKYLKTVSFLQKFTPQINVVDIAKPKDYLEKELSGKALLQAAEQMVFSASIETNVLTGNNYLDTLKTYIDRNKPDLVIPYKRKRKLRHDSNDLLKNLIKNAEFPVLF